MPAYSHLSDEERDQIGVMTAAGRSIGAIAEALSRAKSTYLAGATAQSPCKAAAIRRFTPPEPINCAGGVKRSSKRIISSGPSSAIASLKDGRPNKSPGWLRAGHERGLRVLGLEAIYAFVYRAARKGEELWRYLTRRHKRRRPRRARPSRDLIKDRSSIHDRPKEVNARADIGH